jgi:poly(A) polymerase Pap1
LALAQLTSSFPSNFSGFIMLAKFYQLLSKLNQPPTNLILPTVDNKFKDLWRFDSNFLANVKL